MNLVKEGSCALLWSPPPFTLDLPAGADPLEIAAGINPGTSGWVALADRREEVGALDTVLVLGATGMSGSMAVQAAFALGAERVVAAGRDPEALDRLRSLGATTVSLADTTPDALAAALRTTLAGTTPTLVLDYLWGWVAVAAFAALGAPYTAYPLSRVDDAWAHRGRTRAVVVPD